MPKIFFIIIALFILKSCTIFDKPEIDISPNQWTGKKIYFVDLDDDYKKTAAFNRVWSKLYAKRFHPYHRLQHKQFTIIGTYETWKNDYLIIQDGKGRLFKKLFNFQVGDKPNFPSYILFHDILDSANAMIGKTIWLNNTLDFKGFYSFADYEFKRFESVIVVDVHQYQNSNQDYPIWLKVKAKNGLEGFVRFNGKEGRIGIQDHYYTSDPLPREWEKKVIELIQNRKIKLGMTERQLRLAIGNPDELHHTSSRHGLSKQWVYGTNMGERTYYQFENGKLIFVNE
tara:strand:- start:9724 stop:10578 length:855 start_codon:yes stop_codon:yes gene_type:complete